MNIVEKIEDIMKERGITRYQIEKELGIKQSTFKNWINGADPGLEKIITILKYLEISADEIFGLNNQELNQELKPKERLLLEAYRRADEKSKKAILSNAEILAPEQKEKSLDSKTG